MHLENMQTHLGMLPLRFKHFQAIFSLIFTQTSVHPKNVHMEFHAPAYEFQPS